MTYLQASNRPSKERAKFIIIIIIIFVIIIGGIQFFMPHFLPSIFTTIARPFWRMEFSIKEGSLRSQESLLNENAELRRTIESMRVESQSVQEISDQNAEFLVLLGRKELTVSTTTLVTIGSSTSTTTKPVATSKTKVQRIDSFSNKILAAVLVRPPYAKYDELIIDIGADHGLVKDSKVYAPGGVLIGKISDVLGDTAKVLLYSSPGQSYSVLIGASRIEANAVGRGGGQYTAQVPQASVVSVGDYVSDATISDAPMGTVVSVLSNPADPFQLVLFASSVNIYQLRWVLVENQK